MRESWEGEERNEKLRSASERAGEKKWRGREKVVWQERVWLWNMGRLLGARYKYREVDMGCGIVQKCQSGQPTPRTTTVLFGPFFQVNLSGWDGWGSCGCRYLSSTWQQPKPARLDSEKRASHSNLSLSFPAKTGSPMHVTSTRGDFGSTSRVS